MRRIVRSTLLVLVGLAGTVAEAAADLAPMPERPVDWNDYPPPLPPPPPEKDPLVVVVVAVALAGSLLTIRQMRPAVPG
jgi:hypothetical protein